MSGSPGPQYSLIDSASVIANCREQSMRSIFDFRFDSGREGVTISVDDGFAPDTINLIGEWLSQSPWATGHGDTKCDFRLRRELPLDAQECLFEVQNVG